MSCIRSFPHSVPLLSSQHTKCEGDSGNKISHLLVIEKDNELLYIQLCHNKDVDLNSKNSWERIPLFLAVEAGHSTAVKLLLKSHV